MKDFELTRRAIGDLQAIWEFVSEDSYDAADRLIEDFYRAFHELSEMPRMGHKRSDHPEFHDIRRCERVSKVPVL